MEFTDLEQELLTALQRTNDILGKLTDGNIKKYYGRLVIQYDENMKLVERVLGEQNK